MLIGLIEPAFSVIITRAMARKNTVDCYQMCLPFGQNADTLREYLSGVIGKPVDLTLTNNSTSLLSVNERKVPTRVRLHRIFLAAGEAVIKEIAEYIGARREQTPLFWEFVRDNRSALPENPGREARLYTRGRFHDLANAYASVNNEYFNNELDCKITWGRRTKSGHVRHRTLGSYTLESDTVRINPVLDRASVPRYYVEFIVYHEMLHARIYREQARDTGAISMAGGRRVVHSAEFKRREKLFSHYQRAIRFERGR